MIIIIIILLIIIIIMSRRRRKRWWLKHRHPVHWKILLTYGTHHLQSQSRHYKQNLHIFLSLSCAFMLVAGWRLSYSYRCFLPPCRSQNVCVQFLKCFIFMSWKIPEYSATHAWFAGFHCEVDDNCTLLGYYRGSSGNSLPNYQYSLHSNPEEHSIQHPKPNFVGHGDRAL